MKDVVCAMIQKYGLEDVLTEIGRGIDAANDAIYVESEANTLFRKCCVKAAIKVYEARNEVRELSQ